MAWPHACFTSFVFSLSVYSVFKDRRCTLASYKTATGAGTHIRESLPTLTLLPLKKFLFLFFSIPFSNLLYEAGLSLVFTPLQYSCLLTKVSPLPFFFSRLFMRLSLFHFTASFLCLSITISIRPTSLIRKHCIYSLGSHCFSLFSKK